MNNYSEMWAEFCFLLSENINRTLPEKDFENQVVRALEVLGWREFKNEIERQPTVQLGRDGTLRPDLIIYDNDKKALIVIEVKRPSEDIARDNIIGQLRSYMRQMKSDFGFLVGADLRVYYDGLSNPSPDPILLERIDFARDSGEGIKFFELFNKQSFINGEYQEYLETKIRKFNKKREVKSVIDKILLFETKQAIISHLRNEFADVGDETFSEAIDQISIDISRNDVIETSPARPERYHRPPKREFMMHQRGNIAGQQISQSEKRVKQPKADLQTLVRAGLLREGQKMFLLNYKERKIEGYEATISGSSLLWKNKRYSMSELAKICLKQEGFSSDAVRGPAHWCNSDGISVKDLWNQFLSK